LIVTYIFLFVDKIHRAIISLVGAVAMIVVGKLLDFYKTLPDSLHDPLEGTALGAIDWNTLGLLFGMMIIVGILEETGIFEYIAIRIAKMTKGNYWYLMIALGWFTFISSALLDNVTSIIFVSSITISISSILRINPVPLLISEAIMSGVGGMATLVGDPPNIMIGSAAGFSFLDFVIYLAPVAIVVGIGTTLIFRYLFRLDIASEVEDTQGLMQLEEKEAIREPDILWKMGIVFVGVMILFIVHHMLHLLPSEVAIMGAAVALIWIRPNLMEVLNRTKWDVLLFFAGLFVIVGGLEAAGVLNILAGGIGGVVAENPILALLVVLWGAAFLSAIVDNIPFTIAFIPIIVGLDGLLGSEVVFPIWWALAAGVAIGGCATPIGASANVYVMSLSERTGLPISFKDWLKVGVPSALVQLVIASILLLGMDLVGII
jgi:Na+/H+ antiporter NhaD/arsenite permease-like protein